MNRDRGVLRRPVRIRDLNRHRIITGSSIGGNISGNRARIGIHRRPIWTFDLGILSASRQRFAVAVLRTGNQEGLPGLAGIRIFVLRVINLVLVNAFYDDIEGSRDGSLILSDSGDSHRLRTVCRLRGSSDDLSLCLIVGQTLGQTGDCYRTVRILILNLNRNIRQGISLLSNLVRYRGNRRRGSGFLRHRGFGNSRILGTVLVSDYNFNVVVLWVRVKSRRHSDDTGVLVDTDPIRHSVRFIELGAVRLSHGVAALILENRRISGLGLTLFDNLGFAVDGIRHRFIFRCHHFGLTVHFNYGGGGSL